MPLKWQCWWSRSECDFAFSSHKKRSNKLINQTLNWKRHINQLGWCESSQCHRRNCIRVCCCCYCCHLFVPQKPMVWIFFVSLHLFLRFAFINTQTIIRLIVCTTSGLYKLIVKCQLSSMLHVSWFSSVHTKSINSRCWATICPDFRNQFYLWPVKKRHTHTRALRGFHFTSPLPKWSNLFNGFIHDTFIGIACDFSSSTRRCPASSLVTLVSSCSHKLIRTSMLRSHMHNAHTFTSEQSILHITAYYT